MLVRSHFVYPVNDPDWRWVLSPSSEDPDPGTLCLTSVGVGWGRVRPGAGVGLGTTYVSPLSVSVTGTEGGGRPHYGPSTPYDPRCQSGLVRSFEAVGTEPGSETDYSETGPLV